MKVQIKSLGEGHEMEVDDEIIHLLLPHSIRIPRDEWPPRAQSNGAPSLSPLAGVRLKYGRKFG